MNKPDAVIFDLFGTLVPAFPPERFPRSLDEMADAVGVGHDGFRRMWIHETAENRSTGQFASIADNVLHIARSLGTEPTGEQVLASVAIRNAFTREILQPRSDAIPTLRALRAAGVRCGMISDCSAEVPDIWNETDLPEVIESPIFSCSAGTKKPDPAIYYMACSGLGVDPTRCLYVGDGFSQELSGAARVGMYPILLAAPGEIVPDYSEHEGTLWGGDRIQRLSELLALLGIEHQKRDS